jgi:hypothetical protein
MEFYVLRLIVWLPSEVNLLCLRLISGDNNFICRSSAHQMPRQ